MAIVWPTGLPDLPMAGNYAESPPNNWIRTEMDEGPAKVRLKTTANVRPLNVTFELTKTELATFDTFFVTTTSYGTAEWEYDNPRTGVTEDYRFASQPRYSNQGGDLWMVSFVLEQLP